MEKTEKMANIEPVRLNADSEFQFKCHKGVKCFNQCCRDINIILTPYDIIRLKARLGLSSEEFLTLYTEPQLSLIHISEPTRPRRQSRMPSSA